MRKLILTLLPLIVLNCSLLNEEENSKISIKTNLHGDSRSLTGQLAQISLKVTAGDMMDFNAVSNSNSISASIPKGKDRTFTLTVKLIDGSTYSGSSTVDLINNHEEVFITLKGLLDSFTIPNSGELLSDVEGTIIGNNIYLGLPQNTKSGNPFTTTNLGSAYTHRGINVSLSSNDFTGPVDLKVEDSDGNFSNYRINVFKTFDPINVGTSLISSELASYPEMEPGIDKVGDLLYLSFADSSDLPIIKTYDPVTGTLSSNIFNAAGAPASPRYFKVTGTSKDDLYFAYVDSNYLLSIYHFDGSTWSLKVNHTTERKDVDIAVYKNYIYLMEGTTSNFKLYRFNTNSNLAKEQIAISPTDSYVCVTNSLSIIDENNIYILLRGASNTVLPYHYNGATLSQIAFASGTLLTNADPESLFASGSRGSNALWDIYSTPSGKTYYMNTSDYNELMPSESSLRTRSFYDGASLYRTVHENNKVRLHMYNNTDWSDLIWNVPTTFGVITKQKVLQHESHVFSYYLNDSNLELIHASK